MLVRRAVTNELERKTARGDDAAEPTKPLYQQIRDQLIRRIIDGEWRPGEQMPGEAALALEYDVSVGTARKAITELVSSKLVVRQRGRGTTVARADQGSEPFRFYRFRAGQDGVGTKVTFGTRYLSCENGTALAGEARLLDVPRGTGIVRIVRLRSQGSDPAVVEEVVLPSAPFRDLASGISSTGPLSIYGYLERHYHVIVGRVAEAISVSVPSAQAAKILGLGSEQSVLTVRRQAFDLGGSVVEARVMYAGSGIHYANEIG